MIIVQVEETEDDEGLDKKRPKMIRVLVKRD
jgi:hypothetical protein